MPVAVSTSATRRSAGCQVGVFASIIQYDLLFQAETHLLSNLSSTMDSSPNNKANETHSVPFSASEEDLPVVLEDDDDDDAEVSEAAPPSVSSTKRRRRRRRKRSLFTRRVIFILLFLGIPAVVILSAFFLFDDNSSTNSLRDGDGNASTGNATPSTDSSNEDDGDGVDGGDEEEPPVVVTTTSPTAAPKTSSPTTLQPTIPTTCETTCREGCFSVTGFLLVDAVNDRDLRPLVQGETLSLDALQNAYQTTRFTIVCTTTTLTSNGVWDIGSVGLRDNYNSDSPSGTDEYLVDNAGPYTLAGDIRGNYFTTRFRNYLGDWTVTCEAFCEAGLQGDSSGPVSISFTVQE